MINVIIHGYLGKMGQTLKRLIDQRDDMQIVCGIDIGLAGKEDLTGESGTVLCSKPEQFKGEADAIIDFSNHAAVKEILYYAKEWQIPCIVATTGLTEDVTGPLCVSPLHYAVITVDGADVGYAAATLDLYAEEARRRFVDPVRQSVDTMLRGLALTEVEREEMAGFAASLNQAYFAGDTDTIAALRDSPTWTLWREKGRGTALYPYLRSIFDEP